MDIIFIIFLLAVLAVGILAAESESFLFTTATIISTFVALEIFFNVPVWATIVANPIVIVMYAFVYVAIGAAYTAIWRWPEFIRERSVRIKDTWKDYLITHPHATEEQFINSSSYYIYSASNNKSNLANWVLAWPLSLIWELSRKPTIWVWDTAYRVLGNLFERVGKRAALRILRNK